MKRKIPHCKILFPLVFLLWSFQLKAQLQCDHDTSGFKALIDLKTGLYLGYQGGLYPFGSNIMPYPHYAAGINISRQVYPLNDVGVFDPADGKAGFICLGASTAGNAFNHFKMVAENDTTLNPCMKIVNAAVGAKGLDIMIDTIDYNWYWDDVMADIINGNITRYQVQVIWIMTTSRVDTLMFWPFQPRSITDKYEVLMPILMSKFPNLKQIFVSGFNYGGYADPTKEFYDVINEPGSYWNNWSVKWLVERQINGDPDLKFTYPGKKSPWIGWGPHLWADGMRANYTDGLTWNCLADFKVDGGGYHLSNHGKDKEAEIMYQFFKNSMLAADWFRYGARWMGCDPFPRLSITVENGLPEATIFPNPGNGEGYIEMKNIHSEFIDILIYNATGQIVYNTREQTFGESHISEIKLSHAPAGIYNCLIRSGMQEIGLTFIIN
ncbi:MAG: T9SS type A sorting domain-containing protein [Chitinophagales bacterium]